VVISHIQKAVSIFSAKDTQGPVSQKEMLFFGPSLKRLGIEESLILAWKCKIEGSRRKRKSHLVPQIHFGFVKCANIPQRRTGFSECLVRSENMNIVPAWKKCRKICLKFK
jgi:hypothetical protein